MKILVVEYVPEVRDFLVSMLKKQRFFVDTTEPVVDATESANIGLELALKDKYQIIISNVWSSDLSGLTMIRKIRDEGIDCPILIHSARGRWQDIVAGYMAGSDDYMNFPVYQNDILSRIRNLLVGKKLPDSEEYMTAQKQISRFNGAERVAAESKLLTQDDKEWLPEEVKAEWLAQESKRVARRERKQKAQAFLYPETVAATAVN